MSILDLQWTNRYVAIFRCFRAEKKYAVEGLRVAQDSEIENDPDLRRVLGVLQHDLISKRIYRYADNPTSRLLTFQSPSDGHENEGQVRLNALLQAGNVEEVRAQAQALAGRYGQIPNVREGVLIFLISRGALGDGVAEDCVFIFKCDFEAVSQITSHELFRQVKNAIVEQTKKGALYPYFHQQKFDPTTVRIFDALGQTQYWLEFLGLGEHAPEAVSLQDAIVGQLPAPIVEKYRHDFEELPPVRPLADDRRLIDRTFRLSTADVQRLNDGTVGEATRRTVTLRLGEVRVTAPLNQYGRTWIVAEEAGQRYILIKGSKLDSHTQMLTPIDLADFPSVKKAMAELGI